MNAVVVVSLFISLLVVMIIADAITQYRDKVALQRRQQLMQLAIHVAEAEELLVNSVMLPMNGVLQVVLLNRLIELFTRILDLMPEAATIQHRQQEALAQLKEVDIDSKAGQLLVPNNERHVAALIKTIKKLRFILKSEKSHNNISVREYVAEDSALEKQLTKIFVEYKVNAGRAAVANGKLGTARQFYEKALKTLRSQSYSDDYLVTRAEEVALLLEQVSTDLKELRSQHGDVDEGVESEDDLGNYFSETKKKW